MKIMDAKKKKEYLKKLQQLERQRHEHTNEMVLLDKISKQLSLLIKILIEKT